MYYNIDVKRFLSFIPFIKGGNSLDTYYARQPIFNICNDTIAYELLYRSSPEATSYNFFNGDDATANVINSTFFGGDPKKIFNGRKIYINFTENLLLGKTALLLPKDTLVIEILEDVRPTDEVLEALQELKDNGYRMALDDYVITSETEVFLKYADIVKIDFRDTREHIEDTARICRKKGKRILAEKIETAEELEYAKSLGALFFQGYYFSKPIVISQQNPTPLETTFLHLISKISNDNVELREISKIIKTDAAMTLKFLRFVNFLRYDWMEKIKSVHQAVILAGLNRTKDFIYFVGLHQINQSAIDEVITTGFFRAKFCELLSENLLHDNKIGEEMYLMGLMSIVVDCHFNGSREAVDSLPLSAEIKSGLLEEDGIFGDILKAVLSFEAAKWDEVDEFCKNYQVDSSDLSQIYLACITHTNSLVNGIRF